MAIKESKPLDKNKPYGTIRGRLEGFPNARYSQESRLYDAKEKLIVDFEDDKFVEVPEEETPVDTAPPAPVDLPEEETPVDKVPEPEKKKGPAKSTKAPPKLPGLPTKD